MKIIAINGSPKSKGNTFQSLSIMKEEFEKQGIEMEIIHVGNKPVRGCIGCNRCAEVQTEACPTFPTDLVNETVQKMKQADGIIIGSPVYYSGVAGTMKCFLDRAFYVAGVNGGLFKHKIGAAIASLRRSGGTATLDCLNHYFTISEMPLTSSTYWNAIHGHTPGQIEEDAEGVQTLVNLAKNMAWLLKMREATQETIPVPSSAKIIRTNFIR
ncbi:MAG: flavodoxin family protein [Phocaeicola sp.]